MILPSKGGSTAWTKILLLPWPKILLLLLVSALGLLLLPHPGTGDVRTWMVWIENTAKLGLRGGYAANADYYPPGTVTLLWIADALVPGGEFAAVKGLEVVFLVATAAVVSAWVRELNAATVAIGALALCSVGLGYVDILYAPLLLLALWMLQKERLAAFSVLYASSCLVKWQPIIIAPYIALYVLRSSKGTEPRIYLRRLSAAVVPGTLLVLLTAGLFSPAFLDSFKAATTGETLLSGQALNLNWLFTALYNGGDPSYQVLLTDVPGWVPLLSQVLFAGITLVIIVSFWQGARRFAQLIAASALGILAYFLLNTGVHENHLFVACVVSLVGLWLVPKYRLEFLVIIIMFQVNIVAFYVAPARLAGYESLGVDGVVGGVDVTLPIAALYVLCGAFITMRFVPFLRSSPHEEGSDTAGPLAISSATNGS